ncbi:hypothetical protein GCM10011399_06360 [Subtercola lobariae]|uniref:Uncharacterized protein n=1 Tax=Subtercola lobariae TaxID=1588641 RepID=A0A917B1Q1_9MICO|nr:hypothetical protein GCM10011399_06360 [Subtercola lobariae]
MARIQKFIWGDRDVKAPQTEVDGYVQAVTGPDGAVYLYLYNYAQGGPKAGSTPTQSLCRGRRSLQSDPRRDVRAALGDWSLSHPQKTS